MILLRFARTFRERAPEWALAFIQAGWGGTLLMPGPTFDRPFFQPLAQIASENAWGALVFLTGVTRLAALYINGSRRQTPVVRQACSFVGMLIWALLTFGALALSYRTPAVFNYGGLFILEAIMFSYAGSDVARVTAKAVIDGAR
ncbi:hypothetical protein BH09PSE4_BH09PSE4_21840 [soil metagenome]